MLTTGTIHPTPHGGFAWGPKASIPEFQDLSTALDLPGPDSFPTPWSTERGRYKSSPLILPSEENQKCSPCGDFKEKGLAR